MPNHRDDTTARRTVAAAALLVLAVLALPAGAGAQAAPLRKSDLVHYLSSETYSHEEIAGIIQRSCLAFTPTSRDRDDLKALGATDDVMAAVDSCVSKRSEASARPKPSAQPERKATPPAHVGSLELALQQSFITTPAGSVTSLVAELTRGGKPASGVRLVLRGADRIPGGADQPVMASTDATGRAVFPLAAGTRAATYRLTIEAVDGSPIGGAVTLALTTIAAVPRSAEVNPTVIALNSSTPARQQVSVILRDPFGNTAALQRVELRPAHPITGLSPLSATTNDDGVAHFELPTTPLRNNDTLLVAAAGRTLGTVIVSAAGQVSALMLDAAHLEADGRPAAAEAVYDSVLQAEPGNIRALLGRGAVRSLAGKHQAARADFLRVLRADSANVEALTGLGYSYARSGQYARAEDNFQRALRASPHEADAATGLAYAALWRYDHDQASHRFDVLSAFRPVAYPSDAAEQFRAGVEQLRQGKLASAQYAFTSAIKAAPEWPEAYYNRALVYEAEGWPERARPDLEKYLQLRPAASDRAVIAHHSDELRFGTAGGAFARGLLIPGLGQFSTGRPALGLVVLAGVAGGTAWALSSNTVMETRTFTDVFGKEYTDDVPVKQRPHLTAGLAAAGAMWLFGAAEAYFHTRGTLESGPQLPTGNPGNQSATRSASARIQLAPVVAFRPSGPAFGAGVSIQLW